MVDGRALPPPVLIFLSGHGAAQARHRPGKRGPAHTARHRRGTRLARPLPECGGTLAAAPRHRRGSAAPARRVSSPHSRQSGETLKKLEKGGKDPKRLDSAQSLAVLWWLGRGGAFAAAPALRPEGWGALAIFGGFFGSVPRYSPVFQGVSLQTT